MIAHPELAADVSVRRRIKAGLAQLEKNNELQTFLEPETIRPTYLRYAAAASVLVVVAAGLMILWNREDSRPMHAFFNPSEVGTRTIAASFILANTRSAEAPAFEVQRGGGPIQLHVLVDDASAGPFVARLSGGDDQPPWLRFEESSIPVTTDGFALVYLDPRELDSGRYTLS